jgi:hypothetical protein
VPAAAERVLAVGARITERRADLRPIPGVTDRKVSVTDRRAG